MDDDHLWHSRWHSLNLLGAPSPVAATLAAAALALATAAAIAATTLAITTAALAAAALAAAALAAAAAAFAAARTEEPSLPAVAAASAAELHGGVHLKSLCGKIFLGRCL